MQSLYQPYWSQCDNQTFLVARPPDKSARDVVEAALSALASNDWRGAGATVPRAWMPDWGLRVLFFLVTPEMRKRCAWIGSYDVYRDDPPDAWRWWFKHPASRLKGLLDNGGRYTITEDASKKTTCSARFVVQLDPSSGQIAIDVARVYNPFQQIYDFWRIADIQPL